MFVRLALESDLPEFLDVARIGHEETRVGHVYRPERVTEVFRRYLATANPTFMVVEERGRIIGFSKASTSLYDSTDGFYTTLDVIFVLPEKRGTRAAPMLLRDFVRWSDRLGAKECTGGIDNRFQEDRTAKLMEHFGFERVGHFLTRSGARCNGEG